MREGLVESIQEWAPVLQPKMPWGDALATLGAIAEVESSFGMYAIPRYEKQFDWGGAYFNAEQHDRWKDWGSWVACSYSSFQMMYPTACELGFLGSPLDLWQDRIAIEFVVRFIERRVLEKGATKVSQIADAYNSGSFIDRIFPTEYVKKFADAYASVVVKRSLKGESING